MMEDNKIKNSIDSIRPADGAEERMLQRINKKLEEETPKKPFAIQRITRDFALAAVALAAVFVAFNLGGLVEAGKPKPTPALTPAVSGEPGDPTKPTTDPNPITDPDPTTDPDPDVDPDPIENPDDQHPIVIGPSFERLENADAFLERLGLELQVTESLTERQFAILKGHTAQIVGTYMEKTYFVTARKDAAVEGMTEDENDQYYDFHPEYEGQLVYTVYSETEKIGHVRWKKGDVYYLIGTYDNVSIEELQAFAESILEIN